MPRTQAFHLKAVTSVHVHFLPYVIQSDVSQRQPGSIRKYVPYVQVEQLFNPWSQMPMDINSTIFGNPRLTKSHKDFERNRAVPRKLVLELWVFTDSQHIRANTVCTRTQLRAARTSELLPRLAYRLPSMLNALTWKPIKGNETANDRPDATDA